RELGDAAHSAGNGAGDGYAVAGRATHGFTSCLGRVHAGRGEGATDTGRNPVDRAAHRSRDSADSGRRGAPRSTHERNPGDASAYHRKPASEHGAYPGVA